jgi:hypothetical protein
VLRIVVESPRVDGRPILIVSIALTLHDLLSRRVSDGVRNAPISVSNEVGDRAKDGVSLERYLVDGCLFILSSNENDLAFSINSLSKLDVVYTRPVFQCIQDFQFLRRSKAGIGRKG